jgi:hypothetical protein
MFDWLATFDADKVTAWSGGIGFGLFAVGAIWRGFIGGRPTSAAALAAVEAAGHCRAQDLAPAFQAVRNDLAGLKDAIAELREEIDTLGDLVVRIEDRTRPR